MAILFANDGSYFFPLLYAIIFSSSCYLQHVQSSLATAWINCSIGLFKPFAPTVLCFVLTSMSTATKMTAAVPHFALTSTAGNSVVTMARLIWDPGIALVAHAIGRQCSHPSLRPMPTTTTPTNTPLSSADRPASLLPLYRPHLFAGAATSTTSFFHYCHPVLSRPTVLNIDTAFCSRGDTAFCSSVATMPSLWCLLLLSPACFLSHHGSLLCSIRQTMQQQMFAEPLIHPPWCDCFSSTSEQTLLAYHLSCHMHHQSTFLLDTACCSTSISGLEA